MGVTSGGQDLEDTVVDRQEGDIEGTTSEIVDDDLGFTTLFVKTVCDGGSGRLVDDTKNLETGDGTGILGSLTLGVVEVCEDQSARLLRNQFGINLQAGTVTTAWVTVWPR